LVPEPVTEPVMRIEVVGEMLPETVAVVADGVSPVETI
jgi:hypothetical protein